MTGNKQINKQQVTDSHVFGVCRPAILFLPTHACYSVMKV